jgi:hypothetical protein
LRRRATLSFPRMVLIHGVTLQPVSGSDINGTESYSSVAEKEFHRSESQYRGGKWGFHCNINITAFWDMTPCILAFRRMVVCGLFYGTLIIWNSGSQSVGREAWKRTMST